MKLEDQVCSLDLAKRLKELGVKQESLIWWRNYGAGPAPAVGRKTGELIIGRICCAFTVAELGMMLRDSVGIMPSANSNADGGWYYRFPDQTIHEATEADARAKMLIYLLENMLITL